MVLLKGSNLSLTKPLDLATWFAENTEDRGNAGEAPKPRNQQNPDCENVVVPNGPGSLAD